MAFHSTVACSRSGGDPASVREEKKTPERSCSLLPGTARLRGILSAEHLWLENKQFSTEEAVARIRARHPRQRAWPKCLAIVALDVLGQPAEVDPAPGSVRWAHRLGGKETLYLAALDDRVAGSRWGRGAGRHPALPTGTPPGILAKTCGGEASGTNTTRS